MNSQKINGLNEIKKINLKKKIIDSKSEPNLKSCTIGLVKSDLMNKIISTENLKLAWQEIKNNPNETKLNKSLEQEIIDGLNDY